MSVKTTSRKPQNLSRPPEDQTAKKNTSKNKAVKNCMFLLGVLVGKNTVNGRFHRISLQFPITKGYLAKALKEAFGGSIYIRRRPTGTTIGYDLRSREGLAHVRGLVSSRLFAQFPDMAECWA